MKGQTNAWLKGVIVGEKIIINLITNQADHSDLLGLVITILVEDKTLEYVWEGNPIELIMLPSVEYTILFPYIEGYLIPETINNIALNGNIREIIGKYNTELLTVNVFADEDTVNDYEISILKRADTFKAFDIPENYTILEYIESTGTQYIDTNLYGNQDTKVIIDATVVGVISNDYAQVFGSYTANTTTSITIAAITSSVNSRFGNVTKTGVFKGNIGERHVYETSKINAKMDGIVTTTWGSVSNFTTSSTMYIAKTNGSSVTSKIRVYSCKIYDNDKLIRDYVPVKDPSGEIGLYDKVNSAFTKSESSTEFVAGPSLNNTITEYTKIEYIESDGSLYIDTKFLPDSNTRVVMDMVAVSSNTSFVFGARSSTSTNLYSFIFYNGNLRSDYGTQLNSIQFSPLERFIIDKNKNITLINGVIKATSTTQTFEVPYNLTLMTINTAGSVSAYSKIKLYSCLIYDNDVLVRDYIPVISNKTGIPGLFDKVNNIFYPSIRSSAFTAGPEELLLLYTLTTNSAVYKIPYGLPYIVRASAVPGYTTPDDLIFTASQSLRPVNVIYGSGLPEGTSFSFDYTGEVQSIRLHKGRYRLQCWGAQGGSITAGVTVVLGSKGGYSEGILNLSESKTVNIFVGGKAATVSDSSNSMSLIKGGWNGGGAVLRYSFYSNSSGTTKIHTWRTGGGGATDIALTTSSMDYLNGVTSRSSTSLLSRFIVAGGGAGASRGTDEFYELNPDTGELERDYAQSFSSTGLGSGGGISGLAPYDAYKGKQNSAGREGGFGYGASYLFTDRGFSPGGSGSGWYGGGLLSTNLSSSSQSDLNLSGGGSGFVNTSENAQYRPTGYTGLELESGTTIDGSQLFEAPDGTTETGHSGNGYARITVL